MALNIEKSTGRTSNYKFDAGGMPSEPGPFIGEVMNNVDPTRSGRVQVYIKQFGTGDKTNKNYWRTVSYLSPFAGATPKTSTSKGTGTFGDHNNQMSYGMALNPPDVGVEVMCFFVRGDPNLGYYVGCVQQQGMNHMTPTVGAADNYVPQNKDQKAYFANSTQQPVIEINNAPENTEVTENSKFFDQPKPVHSYVAGIMLQQGLTNDVIRGPITSSSQRESPSNAYGISTPGRPIYQGGMSDTDIKQRLNSGSVTPQDAQVIGRRGGHSLVMDDGSLEGKNSMVRIRTSKGHQITMSDDGNCFYIVHANGQVWLEFGQEGTLDVYATNSINLRTEGTINLHADKDFNVFAGGNINMKSNVATTLQSEGTFTCANKDAMALFSETSISVKSNGELAIQSASGRWNSGDSLALDAGGIDFNSGSGLVEIEAPPGLPEYLMPDSSFTASSGWVSTPNKLKSIVNRAPTHEPYPYHNQGVNVEVKLSDTTEPPPDAPPVPEGVEIEKTADPSTVATAPSSTTMTSAERSAARQAAINEVEQTKAEYEAAKAEFGITSPQAEAAFAKFQAARAKMDAL